MKTELKTSLSRNKTLLLISLLSLLFGALSCVFGEIMLPLLVGALAALYLFDSKSPRTFSITVSVIILALNLAGVILGITSSLFGPCAIILAFIASYSFVRGQSKADSAYVMTIISAVFTVIGCIILAMMEQGEYTLEAVGVFYGEILDSLRAIFISSMSELYTASGFEISQEIIAAAFDMQVRLIVAYLLIGGFLLVGLSMKVFSLAVALLAEEKKHIAEWRFATTNIFAYFYLILTLASMFVMSADSLFAVSVLNLYNIFLVIFAYVGFNFAIAILSFKLKRGMAFFILLILIGVFASFAMQILAVLGVLFTLRNNRKENTAVDQ